MILVYWAALWFRRMVILSILFLLGVGAPIAYTEMTCRPPASAARAAPTTLDTAGRAYAELPLYIVARAEEGYAATLAAGAPHDFDFVAPLRSYWNATCAAVRGGAGEGGLTGPAKLSIYGEGAAFTARMISKAAYEETLGRAATMIRGDDPAPLDTLSADQAAAFAASIADDAAPRWDHYAAAQALIDARGDAPRDWERMIALNLEYRVRGFFRDLVRLPALPEAPPTLRAVVTGIDQAALQAIPAVSVVGPRSTGFQIETAAGADAVAPLTAIARAGGIITDIAGAGGVLVLVQSPDQADLGALVRLPRPDGGSAQVLQVPVAELSPALLRFGEGGTRVERLLGN